MSMTGGGHAAHSSSGSSREHPGGGPAKQLHSKQQQQLTNGGLHGSHGGHIHSLVHHGEIDPHPNARVMGGVTHHQPPVPPKLEAMGMMDPWTRVNPPQIGPPSQFPHPGHPQAHSPLDQQFMNPSSAVAAAAAYYHTPVSPYGAPYGALSNEPTHGGAGWSNGGEVASFFGYPAADFHHPDSVSLSGMFGNGYPAGAYGATGTFGFHHQFTTATHTASTGPAQDFPSWTGGAPGATTAHDMLERSSHPQHHQQKNIYSDYYRTYRYDMMGGTPANHMGSPGNAMGVSGPHVTPGDKMKGLENQMATLSVATQGAMLPHPGPVEHTNSNHAVHDSNNQAKQIPAPCLPGPAENDQAKEIRNPQCNVPVQEATHETTQNGSQVDTKETKSLNNKQEKTVALPDKNDEANNNEEKNKSETKSWKGSQTVQSAKSNPKTESAQEAGEVAPSKAEGDDVSKSQTGSINISAWDWSDEEVKDWSASPPPENSASLQQSSTSTDKATNDEQAHPLLEDLISKNNYNPESFNINVEGARFFVIKSYSEDDVHRSIKYSIWCSTERGNMKLDQAFREQDRQKGGPLYLFYSVNSSGHFCGMAQMTSCVDYQTSTGVWAQDKWKGQFQVKWIYVKDIPNQELRHIRLENNEDKPVTNSRDTQEIPYDKGRLVLDIMHKYRHKTSLFDDFVYYEKMQQALEDERDHHHGNRYQADLAPNSRGGRVGPVGDFRGDIRSKHREDSSPHHNVRDSFQRDNRDYHNRGFRDNRGASNSRSFGFNRENRGFGMNRDRDRSGDSANFSNFRRNNGRTSDFDRDQKFHRERQERERQDRDRQDRDFFRQGDRRKF